MMETVKVNLAALSVEEGSPNFLTWSTPFYDIKNVGDLPVSHQDFKKLKLPVLSPLLPPKLPDVKMNLCWGTLPTLEDLDSFKNELVNKAKDELMSIKKTSAEDILRKTQALPNNQIEGSLSSSYKQDNRKKRGNSVFVTQGSSVGGGTADALNALCAYLRYLEGTIRDDWQEVHEKLRKAEIREGLHLMFFLGVPFVLESFPDGEFILKPSNTRKNEMLDSCHPLDTRPRLLQQQLTVFVQRSGIGSWL